MAYWKKSMLPAALALALIPLGSGAEVTGNWGHLAGDGPGFGIGAEAVKALVEKAASASTVASRGTVTSAITLYGGYEPAVSYSAIIVVRGPSLGTLGITQAYLDSPGVCIYAGSTQIVCGNSCAASALQPIRDYYTNVRGAPLSTRDTCAVITGPAGAYTFTVNPSTISTRTGEVLFEVTLGPPV
jgi:hypothetical protein